MPYHIESSSHPPSSQLIPQTLELSSKQLGFQLLKRQKPPAFFGVSSLGVFVETLLAQAVQEWEDDFFQTSMGGKIGKKICMTHIRIS